VKPSPKNSVVEPELQLQGAESFGGNWSRNKVSALAPAQAPDQKKESHASIFNYHMNNILIKFHYYVKFFIKMLRFFIKKL
jgi:hypothetical protein